MSARQLVVSLMCLVSCLVSLAPTTRAQSTDPAPEAATAADDEDLAAARRLVAPENEALRVAFLISEGATVIDFGLALATDHHAGAEAHERWDGDADALGTRATSTGLVRGTPGYMAPWSEGARGQLLPQAIYDQIPGFPVQPSQGLDYNRMRTVALRFDGCSPTPEGACEAQIRLVMQPITDDGSTLDSALHLFYSPTDEEMAAVVAELRELRAGTDLEPGPLSVHPAIAAEGVIDTHVEVFPFEACDAGLQAIRDDAVRGSCELLGFDPLQVACEGRFAAFVPEADAAAAVDVLRQHAVSANARVIGQVREAAGEPRVTLDGLIGVERIVEPLEGEQLPRIC